jgi:hypothetical protein
MNEATAWYLGIRKTAATMTKRLTKVPGSVMDLPGGSNLAEMGLSAGQGAMRGPRRFTQDPRLGASRAGAQTLANMLPPNPMMR